MFRGLETEMYSRRQHHREPGKAQFDLYGKNDSYGFCTNFKGQLLWTVEMTCPSHPPVARHWMCLFDIAAFQPRGGRLFNVVDGIFVLPPKLAEKF